MMGLLKVDVSGHDGQFVEESGHEHDLVLCLGHELGISDHVGVGRGILPE